MNKKLYISISVVLMVVIFFCGCEEQKALTEGEESGKINLQSDVVKLSESSFKINTKFITDTYTDEKIEIVDNVEVKYLLENIAGRPINIEVSAEFYDKNDNLIGIGGPEPINLPKGYTEKAYTPQNSIIYDGNNADEVHHAVIIVEEK